MIDYAHFAITAITFLVALAAAIAFLRSTWQRTASAELKGLVDARGQVIDDLRCEMAELRDEVHALRAQMEIVQRIKAQEIATETARLLTELWARGGIPFDDPAS